MQASTKGLQAVLQTKKSVISCDVAHWPSSSVEVEERLSLLAGLPTFLLALNAAVAFKPAGPVGHLPMAHAELYGLNRRMTLTSGTRTSAGSMVDSASPEVLAAMTSICGQNNVLPVLAQTSLLLAFTPIQDIRDAAQSVFYSGEVRTTVALTIIGLLVRGGSAAWNAGKTFRERAGTGAFGPKDWLLLAACLALDIAGDATFVLPGGDLDDLIWAPASSFALRSLFGSDALAFFNLGKELLPFTDVLPVATLAWLLRYGFPDSAVSRALGVVPPADTDSKKT